MPKDGDGGTAAGQEPAARIQRLYEAKARAELKTADEVLGRAPSVRGAGDPLGEVVLVKGEPGPDDRRAKRALAGADGDAAFKALRALGFDPDASWMTCSRPDPSVARETRAKRLELIVEAVDPRLVVALDPEAAEDLASAFGLTRLPAGEPAQARGRTLGAVDGLAASLGDEAAKARVWEQLRRVASPAISEGSGSKGR